MKLLFDQGTPVPLRKHLRPHLVDTAAELGWSQLQNGALMAKISANAYHVLVTTDQNLRHQQNLQKLTFGVVALSSTSWPRIQKKIRDVQNAIERVKPGTCVIVTI